MNANLPRPTVSAYKTAPMFTRSEPSILMKPKSANSSARVRLLITATKFRSFCATALAPEPPNCSAVYLMLETNRTAAKEPA